MPELPEVETIRLSLEPQLKNQVITGGEVIFEKLIQGMSGTDFLRLISGRRIIRLERRAKYLVLRLSDGFDLVVHLRMTGQLVVEPATQALEKATHLRLRLENGNELRYRDQRKFGRILLVSDRELIDLLQKLGPEPLEPEFNAAVLKRQLNRHNLAIKKALLNQEIIAGLGNIYTDEALFRAGIHPARPSNALTDDELEKLVGAIRDVLNGGIEHRGTTKRNFCDGEGHPGGYQDQLNVYGRKGESCPQCGNMIVKMTFGGRGTHFCPFCQI